MNCGLIKVSALKPDSSLSGATADVIDLAVIDVDDLKVGHVLQELQCVLVARPLLEDVDRRRLLAVLCLVDGDHGTELFELERRDLELERGHFLLQRCDLFLELGRIIWVWLRLGYGRNRGRFFLSLLLWFGLWLCVRFLFSLGLGFGIGLFLALGVGGFLALGLTLWFFLSVDQAGSTAQVSTVPITSKASMDRERLPWSRS